MDTNEYCPQCGKTVYEHDNYACQFRFKDGVWTDPQLPFDWFKSDD